MQASKELLYFSIATFLVVVAWIVFDVYHALTTSTITTVEAEMMEPVPTGFNHEVILEILERQTP